ncbi:hypothetical protein [Bradyrhizobium sp.]|uniref:hypothetical protein n=1 Tax=Bradyrhizobium sp. TaxID=376 RepID=UPI001ECAE361|nr:hypothetical protein [Bradyrhizobium sp.]MBV8916912.1 hypothetical protein [Bradyrhizobium sp.]MBV9979948.1 hypothetical protein [Bradyrhizobium sp.]
MNAPVLVGTPLLLVRILHPNPYPAMSERTSWFSSDVSKGGLLICNSRDAGVSTIHLLVTAGHVPAIHVFLPATKTFMRRHKAGHDDGDGR